MNFFVSLGETVSIMKAVVIKIEKYSGSVLERV